VPKRTIRDLNLKGRRVFIRVDYNVPLKNGVIADDTRIRETIPTLQFALAAGARCLVLASHLGRPKGKPNPEMSLRPVAARLGELLKRKVIFAEDCVGPAAENAVMEACGSVPAEAGTHGSVPAEAGTHDGKMADAGGSAGSPVPAEAGNSADSSVPTKVGTHSVVLLENLRFHPEEEKNDAGFARALAALADVYVNDAFGAAHRAHASVDAIVRVMPDAGAGLLMEKELRYLGNVLEHPDRPFVAVLGGAKVSDKIEVIDNLIPRVDTLLIGGAMAYTFFKAQGKPTGTSLVEDDKLDAAREILAAAKQRSLSLLLPVDHVVAPKVEAGAPSETLAVDDPAIGDRMGLDIGPKTSQAYAEALRTAKTVVWNGPMGVFEIPEFAKGTIAVANAVADVKGTTIVGGGDSIAAVRKAGVTDRITHISTGGGASLEFLGGQTLPGVAVLPDA
jgi:phosphoglycerate kinase